MVLRRNNGIMSKKRALNIRRGVRPHPMHPSLPPPLPPPPPRYATANTDFLSENFLLKKRKKLLKKNLAFRACLLAGPFLLILKIMTVFRT